MPSVPAVKPLSQHNLHLPLGIYHEFPADVAASHAAI
jgi:hypothetical protein